MMEVVSKKQIYSQDFQNLDLHPQFTLVSAITNKKSKLGYTTILDLLSVELQSPKLVIINKYGGIKGVNQVYIDRYDKDTAKDIDPINQYPDIELIKNFLSRNDNKSCAILSSQESHQNLVQILITEKPISLVSGLSKPIGQQSDIIPPTMFRINIGCQTFDKLDKVDMKKLQNLLTESFGKPVPENYWTQLDRDLLSVTIAGDYDGALIVTSHQNYVYLDKFAIQPNCQGLGVADLLWSRLLRYDNVFWRSRVGNPVNKWYFDRADGYLVKGRWELFFFGARGLSNLKEYQVIVEKLPPTFVDEAVNTSDPIK
jgi:amino-acid N-acetyltransferase